LLINILSNVSYNKLLIYNESKLELRYFIVGASL